MPFQTGIITLTCSLRHVCLVALLLMCGACARTSIDSTKQPGYQFDQDRLLVIQKITAGPIQQGFQSSWPRLMNACGVKTINEIIPDNSDDTERARNNLHQSIAEHLERYHIRTILRVSEVSTLVRTTGFGTPAGALSYKYEATLQGLDERKLWTSIIELSPNVLVAGGMLGTNTTDMGDILAHDIIQQMKSDGVLMHCPELSP